MGKPALLFLSPIMPALGGNGLAMRAGATLEALAADFEVHLLVIPVAGPATSPGEEVRRWCARVLVHPAWRHVDPLFRLISAVRDPEEQLAALLAYPRPALCRFATSASVREAAELASGPAYQAVHTFRLYLVPFAEPYLARSAPGRPHCRLDLDDDEATTRRRIAGLLREDGHERAARAEESEAHRYEALAAAMLPRFDRVYLASPADRARVAASHPGTDVRLLENVVRLPGRVGPPPSGEPFTFVFVGNFGYYPNADAARHFCTRVLPLLRATAPGPFRIRLVGADPPAAVRDLAGEPEVTVTGPVDEVTPCYESAHAVVVPVRAGGGTRIKVLEAFAHDRPVVSTPVGAEGLDVTSGRELLLAGTPACFAAACVRLMTEPSAGRALADRAGVLVRQRLGRLRESLAEGTVRLSVFVDQRDAIGHAAPRRNGALQVQRRDADLPITPADHLQTVGGDGAVVGDLRLVSGSRDPAHPLNPGVQEGTAPPLADWPSGRADRLDEPVRQQVAHSDRVGVSDNQVEITRDDRDASDSERRAAAQPPVHAAGLQPAAHRLQRGLPGNGADAGALAQ